MRHHLTAALLCLVLAFPAATGFAAPPAPSQDAQRETLVSLLSAFELRLNRTLLDTVGPDVNQLLIEISNYPRVRARTRTRAIAALGFYASYATSAYLRSLLNERSLIDTALGTNLRRQALRSLGLAFGDAAVDDILALKDDHNVLIREAVAHALGDAASTRGRPALEAWLSREPNLSVRVAIDHAIDRLRRR